MRLLSLSRHHPPRHAQRGSTAVEFSLVFPLFMALMFGAIDGGRFVISHCVLSNAVIVGGRLASVASTASSTAVQTAVVGAAPFLSLTNAAVTVAVTHGGTATTFAARATGDTVSVSATYSFRAVLPLLTNFASRSYAATSAVTVE